MQLIKLSLSLIIQLSLAGDIQGSDVIPKIIDAKLKDASRPLQDNKPRPMDKRSRILKFGKYDHAGRCILVKCDWLELPLYKNSIDGRIITESLPKILHSKNELENQQFGFKERKVKMKDTHELSRKSSNLISSNLNINSMLQGRSGNRLDETEINITLNSDKRHDRNQDKGKTSKSLKKSKISESLQRVWKRNVNDEGLTRSGPTIGTVECETIAPARVPVGNESRLPYDWDHDSYMALGSLSFLLFVLTSAVMYTGLWKKRNTMLYPTYVEQESAPSRRMIDIKELLKAKLGQIPTQTKRIRVSIRSHRNHHRKYIEVPLVENGEAGISDEEINNEVVPSESEEEPVSW